MLFRSLDSDGEWTRRNKGADGTTLEDLQTAVMGIVAKRKRRVLR